MTGDRTTTAARYRRFAEVEARGYSPLYDAWCSGIAEDAELIALIDHLPETRRQPNLLLGAMRFLGVPLDDAAYGKFRSFLLAHWDGIRAVMESRTTQTNEAGRCAVLLPYLAAISASEDRPLALVEVGASAGACLYPDRYSYSYSYSHSHSASVSLVSGTELRPDGGSPVPPLECRVSGEVTLPDRLPEVLWRAGIDLNPLDASDDGDRRWLEALVWPEHTFRAERLRAALDVVRADPPLLVRGDLFTGTADLVARAPADAVVVVFHSAVLAYVDAAGRGRFRDTMMRLVGDRARPMHWLSHEGHGTLAGVPGALERAPGELDGRFVLQHNGRTVARTGPHGQSIEGLIEGPEGEVGQPRVH